MKIDSKWRQNKTKTAAFLFLGYTLGKIFGILQSLVHKKRLSVTQNDISKNINTKSHPRDRILRYKEA